MIRGGQGQDGNDLQEHTLPRNDRAEWKLVFRQMSVDGTCSCPSLDDVGGEGGTAEIQLRDWEFGGRNQEGALDVRSDHTLTPFSLLLLL